MKIIATVTVLRTVSILALSPSHLPVSRSNMCFNDINVLTQKQKSIAPSRDLCLHHQYNNALQFSKPFEPEEEGSIPKPPHSKPNTRRKMEVTDFFRLTPKAHLASLLSFGAASAMFRCKTPSKLVESLLMLLPCASWKNPPKIEPLSTITWAIHLVLYAISLELAGGFYALLKQSNDEGEKKTYRGFFAVYALAFVGSFLTLSAHGMIGVNQGLEEKMESVFRACVRTGIFGTGLSVGVGPWTLIPIFVGVSLDKIDYGNWAVSFWGIVLKLLGMQFGSDIAHCIEATVLTSLFGGMALLLNKKIKYGGINF